MDGKKPLKDYTTGEVAQLCEEHGGCEVGENCRCPFFCEELGCCIFYYDKTPSSWSLDEPVLEMKAQVQLTEEELTALRLLGADYVSRNQSDTENSVFLWRGTEPGRIGRRKKVFVCRSDGTNSIVGRLDSNLVPSLPPGECVKVRED